MYGISSFSIKARNCSPPPEPASMETGIKEESSHCVGLRSLVRSVLVIPTIIAFGLEKFPLPPLLFSEIATTVWNRLSPSRTIMTGYFCSGAKSSAGVMGKWIRILLFSPRISEYRLSLKPTTNRFSVWAAVKETEAINRHIIKPILIIYLVKFLLVSSCVATICAETMIVV
jgi:hypothetical protein